MTKPIPRPKPAADHANRRQASIAIYQGVTVYDLENLFHASRRVIQRKLAGAPSTGKRGQFDTWRLKDIAGLFVKPSGSMEEFLSAATPGDLPVLLQKEYWNGLRAKQAFLAEEGNLWQTERVAVLFGKAFQLIRISLLLMPDELERRSSLNDAQRKALQDSVDVALRELKKMIIENFGEAHDPKDAPGTYNIVGKLEADDLEGVFEPIEPDDDDEDL